MHFHNLYTYMYPYKREHRLNCRRTSAWQRTKAIVLNDGLGCGHDIKTFVFINTIRRLIIVLKLELHDKNNLERT